MASEEGAQAHVQQMEFAKEAARLIVGGLAVDISVQELLDDPQGFIDDVLAAVLNALHSLEEDTKDEAAAYAVELGMAEVDDAELDAIVQEDEDSFLGAMVTSLSVALTIVADNVQAQIDSGIDPSTIEAVLDNSATRDALMGGVFSALRNGAAGLIGDIEHDVMAAALDALLAQGGDAAGDRTELAWITMEDKAVCGQDDGVFENSCDPRHGEVRTMAEWKAVGLPRSPNLLCCTRDPRCRCQLEVAEDGAGTIGEAVKIGAAIKLGKAAARALYGDD